MTDLLSIGSSGIKTYGAALGVVGDNVSNAQTPGYVRRSVEITEIMHSTTPNPLYLNTLRSDGSRVNGVVRSADMFRTADARLSAADYSRANAVSTWLQNAEQGLGNDMTGALATFFSNGDQLAADPNGQQPRIALLDSIDGAANAIRTSATDVARTASSLGDAAQSDVDATNVELSELASINLAIRRQKPGTSGFVELEDQRDRLLDSITARTGASVSVSADGSALVKLGSATLVDLGDAATLSLTRAADDRLSLTSTFNATATGVIPTSGSFSGMISAASTIANRRTQIDALAQQFVIAVNNWQAAGKTPAGTSGPALLSIGATATTLAYLGGSFSDVAAASTTTGNGNALALATVRSSSGIEAAAAALISQHASATSTAKNAETQAGNRRDTAAAARDQVEGVDLDREAADLLRFQQAYQGAARVIQAAKETIDTILALFR